MSRSLPPHELPAGAFVLRAVQEEDWCLEAELSNDAEMVRWTSYPVALSVAEAS